MDDDVGMDGSRMGSPHVQGVQGQSYVIPRQLSFHQTVTSSLRMTCYCSASDS